MRLQIEANEKDPRHDTQHDYAPAKPPKTKGRISGFIAALLTILYAAFIISYFGDIGMDSLSGFIANSIVTPHIVCVVIAAVFSLVGFFVKKRWAMLTAGILMAASAALFPTYAMFVIVQSILFFISYARMH